MAEEHDPLDFLDETPETTAAVVGEGEGETTTSQEQKPVVDGKTGTQEELAEGEVKDGDTTKVVEGDKDKGATATVPVTALLDEREKRQKAERELEDVRKNQKPADEEVIPDPEADPVAFARYQQEQTTMLVINERLNTSERFAAKEHGAELVATVKDWATKRFETDPAFAQKVLLDADPYAVAISEYNDAQLRTQTTGMTPQEIEEFKAWKAGKAKEGGSTADINDGSTVARKPAEGEITPEVKPQQVQEELPRTIAAETSAGGKQAKAAGPGQAFDDVFAH